MQEINNSFFIMMQINAVWTMENLDTNVNMCNIIILLVVWLYFLKRIHSTELFHKKMGSR